MRNNPNTMSRKDLWNSYPAQQPKKQSQSKPILKLGVPPMGKVSQKADQPSAYPRRTITESRVTGLPFEARRTKEGHEQRATRHDFAKQTQFAKMRNNPNPMSRKDLWNIYPAQQPKKQSQFKPNQTQFSSLAPSQSQTPHLLPLPCQFPPHHLIQSIHPQSRTAPRPKKLVRGKTYDYAKQTQFAKMRNKPKPMSKKDLWNRYRA